jgi:ABC-type glutathione transport system ATPase component
MTVPLLSACEVELFYPGMSRPALHRVSLTVSRGDTLGIVGESGSGKSSLARCFLGMEKLHGGKVLFRGEDVRTMTSERHRGYRRGVQLVFQDPFNSLNPRYTVGETLGEIFSVHRIAGRDEIPAKTGDLLDRVGLHPKVSARYPHELSGGQRQRVGIARALALQPEVLIADEPVSALDVSVQAQILNLLKDLAADLQTTLILIAHDLAVVRYVCRRMAVMREGVIVEEGVSEVVLEAPRHPYTKKLISAVPTLA